MVSTKTRYLKNYAVCLLQSGLDVGQFKTLTEAKKAATYKDDNLSFNNIEYGRKGDGTLVIKPTDEFKSYLGAVKQVLDTKPYAETDVEAVAPEATAETVESVDVTPIGQLFEDYGGTVDGILTVSDETAKPLPIREPLLRC